MHHQDSKQDRESDGEPSEPEPDCVPVSRWRNRRRWFYVAVVAAALACLGGGWVWWYRAGFPFPSPPIVDPASANLMTDVVLSLWGQAQARQEDLVVWKVKRETKRLQLAGTIWEDAYYGLIVEFSSEGGFHWRRAPWMREGKVAPPADTDSDHPATLEGRPWHFLREVPLNFGFGSAEIIHPPNLEFPGSDWSAYLLFDGRYLSVVSLSPEGNDAIFPYPPTSTRQPSPRD